MCDEIGKTFEREEKRHFLLLLSLCITYIHTDNFPAGTARKAELGPNLPTHLFAAIRDKNANAQNTETLNLPSRQPKGNLNSKDAEKPKTNTSRPHQRDMTSINTKPRWDVDNFDGDDLQLDDFLVANERRGKAKESTKPQPQQFDDIDWFSIDSTPPSPVKRVPKVANPREDDWAVDMDEPEDEYEPVRLANGKWACNHKCKDKTRFERIIAFFIAKLIIPAANISAAARVWKSPRSHQSGQSPEHKRKPVSINSLSPPVSRKQLQPLTRVRKTKRPNNASRDLRMTIMFQRRRRCRLHKLERRRQVEKGLSFQRRTRTFPHIRESGKRVRQNPSPVIMAMKTSMIYRRHRVFSGTGDQGLQHWFLQWWMTRRRATSQMFRSLRRSLQTPRPRPLLHGPISLENTKLSDQLPSPNTR